MCIQAAKTTVGEILVGKQISFFDKVFREKNTGEGRRDEETHQPGTLCGPHLNLDPN